jgi:NAD(P)H-dependent FMN reductase
MFRIAIIISTTRDNRFGDKPARWIHEAVSARTDLEAEIVDLRDFDLPFFNEVASSLWVPSQSPEALRWQAHVASFDGYIFVTAEYNRSIPAALKNALDYAYNE